MAFKAKFDRGKLERSLKKYAKQYGEVQSQAVVRWSIQTCRELALETQVWGKSKTKQRQRGKIIKDATNVILVVDRLDKSKSGGGFVATNRGKQYYVPAHKVIKSAIGIEFWIEQNRRGPRKNTVKLPIQERKVCTKSIFKAGIKDRIADAGIAKGGWLGAGMDIAKAQSGQNKISIGQNFLAYARKHSSYGTSKEPKDRWKPAAYIVNKAKHSSNRNVLANSGIKKSIQFGLKKTLTFYRKALRALDKKTK